MREANVVNAGESSEEGQRKAKLIKRHAKESWLYPVITYALNIFGLPLVLLQAITIPMGIYCLIKSYISIRNGSGSGIVSHVVIGSVLNFFIVLTSTVLIFYTLKNR